MPNIEEQPTRLKGCGGELRRNLHNKVSNLMVMGCFKHPEGCDTCNIPVHKCSGNFKSGSAC